MSEWEMGYPKASTMPSSVIDISGFYRMSPEEREDAERAFLAEEAEKLYIATDSRTKEKFLNRNPLCWERVYKDGYWYAIRPRPLPVDGGEEKRTKKVDENRDFQGLTF